MNWYLHVLKNYTVFNGRARRKEYWTYELFSTIFAIVALIIDNIIGTTIEGLPFGLLFFIYVFAIAMPDLAVGVRRLHDIGKSGWFFFVIFIPILGVIWLIIELCKDGVAGENEYGVNPKEIL